jgi:hypothetical protein
MLRRPRGAEVKALWVALCALLAGSSCLVDSDHRCGDDQRLADGLCLCVEGYALQAGRCVATSVKSEPDGGIGVACTPGSLPCSDPDFPLCQTAASGRSYCTSTGCSTSADCSPGFVCNRSSSPSYCRRFYEGQKETCTSTADCARFDAQYCVVQLNMCIVRDCEPDSCDPDWTCFDLSQILPGEPKVCAPNELIPK